MAVDYFTILLSSWAWFKDNRMQERTHTCKKNIKVPKSTALVSGNWVQLCVCVCVCVCACVCVHFPIDVCTHCFAPSFYLTSDLRWNYSHINTILPFFQAAYLPHPGGGAEVTEPSVCSQTLCFQFWSCYEPQVGVFRAAVLIDWSFCNFAFS